MSLDKISQDQLDGFLQVLQKKLSELDQELKLAPKKRRMDREIEFDKRMVIQSLNAIQRYKTQSEIRVGSVKNNLIGLETPRLFNQFLEELEGQQQPSQPEVGIIKSVQEIPPVGPETGLPQVITPTSAPVPEVKIPASSPAPIPEIKPPVGAPVSSAPAKSTEPPVVVPAPAPVFKPPEPVKEAPVTQLPVKPPETVAVIPAPPSQPFTEPIVTVPNAPENTAPKTEQAPGVLIAGPVKEPEPEIPEAAISSSSPEPVVQETAAPAIPEEPVISQMPFTMPVPESEVAEEEPVPLPEEPGVPWNGIPRVGNIFRGQKGSYQLEKCLSTGKYSELWEAVVFESTQDGFNGATVALKIANPGLTSEEKQQFEAEINVLDQLKKHIPEDLLRIDGKLLVPEVFEAVLDPDAAPQRGYVVQSMAFGRPVDELRRDKSRMPELEALEITTQLCRVLQALHEGLQMSLVDFQENNIFWDEHERRIFFAVPNQLSTPEQSNFAGDVISTAGELYQLVMGVPAPAPGSTRLLAEPLERWNELSQGTQDILARAFNPFRPYQSMRQLREDLEWLGEWWERTGDESLVQFKNLINALPQNEQFDKKYSEQLEKVLWGAGVLEKLALRPEMDGQLWVTEFQELRSQLSQRQTGAYWLEKGQKTYQSRSWDLAEGDFRQALKDVEYHLAAARWLQALKAARSKEASQEVMRAVDIAMVEEAMSFFQQGKFAEAASVFEELASGAAQQDFSALATEARLQAALQRVPGLLEGRQYKELAEVYQNAIEWMRSLPRDYREVLKPGFEDFEIKQREYTSRYKKIQKLQERFSQLKSAQHGKFSEYYGKLKELLDQQPGDVELLERGKEGIYQYLAQGRYAEGRALAALCLDYNCGADPYLNQVWQYASRLERCWQAWSTGNGPAFRNAILNQAWPSELWARLVEKILEKTLELPGQYFVAEFLHGILTYSKLATATAPATAPANPKIREQITIEKDRMLGKVDDAFRADEEAGTDLLVKLIQEHPYSLVLFNEASAKVEVMLQHKNFSAALTIAQAAVSQFSILDLKDDAESVAQVLTLLRSFVNSAVRILPLQRAWLKDGAVGLANQLEEENPWREGARWVDEELVFLRDFLGWCLDKIMKKDFLGWNLVISKIDPGDILYLRMEDKREELEQEFQDGIQESLQSDVPSGLESLRVLWLRYPMDPILERVSLEVLDHEFLFKDEHAEKAHKIFSKLSGCSQTLKERIWLCVKNAQYYRVYPEDPERTSKEMLDKLYDVGKLGQPTVEKAAFFEAVHHSWFKQALDKEDLAVLQKSLTLLSKDKWTRDEVEGLNNLRKMYTQTVQSLADRTSEALKKGEQIEQQPVGLAAKLMKNLQKQPGPAEVLLEWDGLISDLRIWIGKTRQAGWNEESFRLESYLEKLNKIYARVELLTARKISETNLVLISEIWKLALPGTPEDPQGPPKETPRATDDNRRQWLLQMDKACQELLKNFPKDSQKQVWLGWQSRIQAELRKIQ